MIGGAGNVVKYDLADRRTARPTTSARTRPRPSSSSSSDDDAAGEDEGWAIGFVYDDTPSDSSDLVILDGSAPGAEPVARVHLPMRVPYGFHGSWVDDAELAR